ncbi:MAG: thiamine pyrophosphate-binding protein [Anaerolineales bacterium]|nr:thiamine pyrophosphate-binding protein [Anaerolineales bacterium]MCB8952213.1 thiamine pyrophosphate-binding protein [Ardenticatenales bacterium]
MKKTGAFLAVYALEQIGVTHTFGIPGVHNTELYDALSMSEKIEPILVTHEGAGAFMAEGISRTSETIGTLVIVPAAGMTHAMSGIGEAYLDGIPLLVISGGTRRDSGRHYQLHQLDQGRVLDGIIKQYYLVERHEEIIPTIYAAYDTATDGEPGPVFVEIPVEVQMFQGEVSELPVYRKKPRATAEIPADEIRLAVDLLIHADHPGIYVGWGAVDAAAETAKLAEMLVAPVATTMQGLSAFPANHGLHVGVGFGAASVPAAQAAFADCDCLLAVGARFGELATGSYSMPVPETLIHVDINPQVFHKNYPATVAIAGDAGQALAAICQELAARAWRCPRDLPAFTATIQANKEKYTRSWRKRKNGKQVSPGFFFEELRRQLAQDAIVVVDDGKHTFLAAELFPVYRPRHFISPTDFNCMGYCVPASIGAKLTHPQQQVAAIVGDGAFLMTGMELLTAVTHKIGVMVFVFHDGELGQISQFQQIPLNRKTCTVLGQFHPEGIAQAVGSRFLAMRSDADIAPVIRQAQEWSAQGQPVLIDVNIDYSRRTNLTKGVVKENLNRFPGREKVRFISRALKRRITG